ncbi:tryptophan dimethylallyltransferase family protein [Streptomyces europaeiscabiei]|uniref:tryptophan dimethylallyltransferase family protein n=1 Tax=Streptomyces europaeiscabiei TaxID=146819 RepID=UPI0038F67668
MTAPHHTYTGASVAPEVTLGQRLDGQLGRLCRAAGVPDPVGAFGASLRELLGEAAQLPLTSPPPSLSLVSDDHTPAELSLSLPWDRSPSVRILADPGCTADTLADAGRAGLAVVERLAAIWGFSREPLRRIADLFLPDVPHGDFALWVAMELRPHGDPGFKVYVDPAAHGADRAADVVEEALARLGHAGAWPKFRHKAAARYPEKDRFAYFAVDLGAWDVPRVKVYVAHSDVSVGRILDIAGLVPGHHRQAIQDFCRIVGGSDRFDRRPLVSCFSCTGADRSGPTAYTLHLPIRDYATDDAVARARAVAVLRRHGVGPALLDGALAAMTRRHPADGVGLISYLSLVRQRQGTSRVTAYFAPEAYRVFPPRTAL